MDLLELLLYLAVDTEIPDNAVFKVSTVLPAGQESLYLSEVKEVNDKIEPGRYFRNELRRLGTLAFRLISRRPAYKLCQTSELVSDAGIATG